MRRRLVLLVAAVVAAGLLSAATAASNRRRSRPKLTSALAGPSLSLARTSAVAVDLATGTVLFAHNPALPSRRRQTRSFPSRGRRSPSSARVPLPHGGLRRRRARRAELGRGPRAQGVRRPDAWRLPISTALAAVIRGRGIRDGDGTDPRRRVVLRHEARRGGLEAGLDRDRVSPALRPRRRPRARAGPRCRPRCSPRGRSATRSSDGASPSRGRPASASRPETAVSLASDTSDPLSRLVAHMNHESDNFYAEMLLKQLVAATGNGGHLRRRRPASSSRRFARPAFRSRAPDRRRVGAVEPRPNVRADGRGRDRRRSRRPHDQGARSSGRSPSRA